MPSLPFSFSSHRSNKLIINVQFYMILKGRLKISGLIFNLRKKNCQHYHSIIQSLTHSIIKLLLLLLLFLLLLLLSRITDGIHLLIIFLTRWVLLLLSFIRILRWCQQCIQQALLNKALLGFLFSFFVRYFYGVRYFYVKKLQE